MLTSGKLSRLHRRLVVGEALATSVSANKRPARRGLWIYAEAAEGADTAALEAAIEEEVGKACDRPVARRSWRARRSSSPRASLRVRDHDGLAETSASTPTPTGATPSITRRRDAVTAVSLQEICARLLDPGRRVVAWCGCVRS